jgi:hypothetical protein
LGACTIDKELARDEDAGTSPIAYATVSRRPDTRVILLCVTSLLDHNIGSGEHVVGSQRRNLSNLTFVNVANIFDEISMQLATNLNGSLIVVLSKEPLPWPPLLGLARVSHPSCDLYNPAGDTLTTSG